MYYTSVHPLSNTNLIYIYMFILLYANCVVMYCVSFYVVVGNKRYLILSYLILCCDAQFMEITSTLPSVHI